MLICQYHQQHLTTAGRMDELYWKSEMAPAIPWNLVNVYYAMSNFLGDLIKVVDQFFRVPWAYKLQY